MKLIVLGSGTAHFSPASFPAGYLLQTKNKLILFDGGAGVRYRMMQTGIHPNAIDIIAYSHLHPDHTAELIPLLFGYRSKSCPHQKELTILGPPDFPQFYQRLNDLYPNWLNGDYPLKIIPMTTPHKDNGLTFTPFPVQHTSTSLAYRLTTPEKSFAYSGDTDYCPNIVAAMQGVDLAVCECSFPDHMPISGHMTPTKCSRVLKEAKPKRLLLTHFYPEVQKEKILSLVDPKNCGNVLLAHDLMEISF